MEFRSRRTLHAVDRPEPGLVRLGLVVRVDDSDGVHERTFIFMVGCEGDVVQRVPILSSNFNHKREIQ